MLQLTITVFFLLCNLLNDATSNSDHIGWNNWATVMINGHKWNENVMTPIKVISRHFTLWN